VAAKVAFPFLFTKEYKRKKKHASAGKDFAKNSVRAVPVAVSKQQPGNS